MMKKILFISLCFSLLTACKKEDTVIPTIRFIYVNGLSDHYNLHADATNSVQVEFYDDDVTQVKITLKKEGLYANHDHGTGVSDYGLLIPNQGDFELEMVQNISDPDEGATFTFDIPEANSGLWNLMIQGLDENGNLVTEEVLVSLDSFAFPFLSITAINSDLVFGSGSVTAAANTPWNWEGSVVDFDSLAYVHMTITQNSDTIQHTAIENPTTWSLPLTELPMAMPNSPGQYQWRLQTADLNGVETWRITTLIVQ